MKFNYIPKQDRQLNTNPNISLAQTREADKLEADLGYLYENVVAQMLTANEKDDQRIIQSILGEKRIVRIRMKLIF